MKVNILLSSYNGEKYIAEQIKSIQAQSVQDWQLIVRDDGSKDRTCEIVAGLAESDPRIRLVQGANVGVIPSFFEALKLEDADFYFFCDQDDVWLPNKLELVLATADLHDNDKPVLYYTDLKVVDKELNVLSNSMIKSQSDHANTRLNQELTENTVTGCTMMINQKLADSWTDTDDVIMHDWYLAVAAAALGELVYIDQPTVLYRQHGDNVLGARTLSKRIKNWTNNWLKKYWWLITSSQKQGAKLLANSELSAENRQLIEDYVGILEQDFAGRRQLLKSQQLKKNRFVHALVFRTLILTKLAYKKQG
ncbi:glycosyltransferase family 2 protein [Lactococcus termiticola]|uniref:Alpha-L-Rha alpha-1,3-L-rhamnosyltransferase n=1 Tax=Lactococcus termiticola TaxID=2169526 RepID=A0A2R5HFE5_9LACT|nr:glycosyltransferase family 2 protein [Lactococcus termiticola]GBG96556.1 alpha-L-Rha alpha-1,3-L-rhamnosyltransferase [Lactococcus termiticola]